MHLLIVWCIRFATNRPQCQVIAKLEIQVKLTIEDGLKIARVRWLVEGEEERLSIELTNSRNWSSDTQLAEEC
jgi:hypothetical protein